MMWGADGWWWGWIMMATFWVVVVWLVVWAIRSGGRSDRPARGESDAERRLDERFADGEIDADEYASRRDLLHRGARR